MEETFYKNRDMNLKMDQQAGNKKGKNVIETTVEIDTEMINKLLENPDMAKILKTLVSTIE